MKVKIKDTDDVTVELEASIFELADLYQATRRTGRRTKEQKDLLESLGDQVAEHPRVKTLVEAYIEAEGETDDS